MPNSQISPEKYEHIRKLLAEKKHTLAAIAKAVGVAATTVSRVRDRQLLSDARPRTGIRPPARRRAEPCPVCKKSYYLPEDGGPCLACQIRQRIRDGEI